MIIMKKIIILKETLVWKKEGDQNKVHNHFDYFENLMKNDIREEYR